MSKNHAEITIPTKSYQKLHGLILQPPTILAVSEPYLKLEMNQFFVAIYFEDGYLLKIISRYFVIK